MTERRFIFIVISVVLLTSASILYASDTPGKTSQEAKNNKIDLQKNAKIFTTHSLGVDEYKIENAIDGNVNTQWIGTGQPLTLEPTNIVLEFDRPYAINKIKLTSYINRGKPHLTDYEIYGWAKNFWAGENPLAVIKDSNSLERIIEIPPVKTERLRIRLRDNWYYSCHPRIAEIEIYEAPTGANLIELKDSFIPGEKRSEQFLLAKAMNKEKAERLSGYVEFPGEKFDTSKNYLDYAKSFMDTMIAKGTDHYGTAHSPLFCSLLDIRSQENPSDIPPDIHGQRMGDRTLHGCNPFHDMMLLKAMDYTTELTGEKKYRQAVTDYLTFFLENCPLKTTGLFPWGEHAHWDFYKEEPAHHWHEFLGGIPLSFWERMWQLNSQAVVNEAEGIMNHIRNLETFDFDRQADIFTPLSVPRPKNIGKGLSFPRHSGFYVSLWTFIYSKTHEQKYLDRSLKMIDFYRQKCDPNSGLPYGFAGKVPVSATLSLAVSLLESSELLPKGKIKQRYTDAAKYYIDSIVRLPHKPQEGQFLGGFALGQFPETAEGTYEVPYRYGYGGGFTADDVLLLIAAYQHTKDRRALILAESFADFYAKNNPPAPVEIVRARVFASIIELFVNLYQITGNQQYLSQAERYAKIAIERLYYNGLFRGATNISHYESEMMVSNLIYSLVHLYAAKEKVELKIEPNYTNR